MRTHGSWVVLGALLMGLPSALAAQQAQGMALIRKVLEGNLVGVQRAGASESVPGVQGDVLAERDLVLTGEGTRAAIAFIDDGTIVRMSPNSEVTVIRGTEQDRNAQVRTINMTRGFLHAVVKPGPERSFQVQTPSGVAAVKGTEFFVRVDPTGQTTIITLDGVVEFFNGAGTADVEKGETVVVQNLNTAPAPRDTQPGDIPPDEAQAQEEAAAEAKALEDTVEVELSIVDATGRERVLTIVLPKNEARAVLGGGNR